MSPTIQSGRPGQSIGSGVVGAGTFQIQSGIERNQIHNNTRSKSYILNNVFRLGISESFEVSSLLNYRSDQFDNSQMDQDGLSAFHLGFRSQIIDNPKGVIPTLAIQTRFKLHATSNNYREQNLAPIIIIATTHSLDDSFSLTHNFGYSGSGNNTSPTYFWTSNLTYSINEKISTFFELYGNITNDIGKTYWDTGFDYLISSDLKFDFSAGHAKNNSVEESFISLGLSWRASIF